jgi:hypothetical protein
MVKQKIIIRLKYLVFMVGFSAEIVGSYGKLGITYWLSTENSQEDMRSPKPLLNKPKFGGKE